MVFSRSSVMTSTNKYGIGRDWRQDDIEISLGSVGIFSIEEMLLQCSIPRYDYTG